jgi:pimeloyl-ACP methyl ester carboxylesterase
MLLHGVPLGPEVWTPVTADLAGAEHVPVITPAVVADTGGIDVHAEIAREILATHRDEHSRIHLVGHSFGGQVALAVAIADPPWVASLTLLCTRDTPFPPFAELAESVLGGQVDPDISVSRWFTAEEIAENDTAVRYTRDAVGRADRRTWAAALAAIATFDCAAQVHRITAPTTVVAAERDAVSTVQTMTEMAGRVERARLHVLEGAGHMSVFSRPSRLAELLLAAAERSG